MTSKSKRIIIKKVLKLTSNYKKAAEYKINIWKSTVFLYTSNEQVEFEIKNTMPFTLVPPQIKYIGINLTKYVKDLHEENYKILMNEIKEQLNGYLL